MRIQSSLSDGYQSDHASKGFLPVAAMVTVGVAGALVMLSLPAMLSVLAGLRHFTERELALLASSELGGATIATLVISAWIARINRKKAAFAVLVMLSGAQLASLVVAEFHALVGVRFCSGLCGGALLGIMSAAIATTATPARFFAVYLTANNLSSVSLLWVLGWFAANGKQHWLFHLFIGVALIALALLHWLPVRPGEMGIKPVAASRPGTLAGGVAGLIAALVLLTGVGATWPLIGHIGTGLGIPAKTVANALAAGSGSGVIAGLLVYFFGQQWGRRIPVIVGTLALAATMLIFTDVKQQAGFLACVCSLMFFWVGVLPFYSEILAELDPEGRLSSLCMGMQFMGLTLGSILAAALDPHGSDLPWWMGAACCLPAIGLALFADRQLPTNRAAQKT